MKTFFIIAFTLMIAGCVTEKDFVNATAGRTGCDPKEIQVSNMDKRAAGASWEATCNGVKYYCFKSTCTAAK
jgi:hypothetical protein